MIVHTVKYEHNIWHSLAMPASPFPSKSSKCLMGECGLRTIPHRQFGCNYWGLEDRRVQSYGHEPYPFNWLEESQDALYFLV